MALVSSLQVDTSATYKVPWRQLLEAILMSTKSNTEQIKNNNNSVLHMIYSAFMNAQFMLELYSLVKVKVQLIVCEKPSERAKLELAFHSCFKPI